MAEQVIGDAVPVKSSLQSSQTGTVPELCDIASAIWKHAQALAQESAGYAPDQLLLQLQKLYPDFNQTFPVVLRWMARPGEFDRDVFRQFLLHNYATTISSKDEFLNTQAEYAVLLYDQVDSRTHRRPTDVAEYREVLRKQLIKEDKDFQAALAELEAEKKRAAARRAGNQKSALIAYLQAKAA